MVWRLLPLVWFVSLCWSTVTYENKVLLRQKRVDSLLQTNDVVFLSPFGLEESLLANMSVDMGNMRGETTLRFRWSSDKDMLYDHDWHLGQRDGRLFPEELYGEWQYDFRYGLVVGKKKWDMSQGFYWKPMLLLRDTEGYGRYGEGLYMVRGEVWFDGGSLSLYGVFPRWSKEAATNQWWDCLQNPQPMWMGGGAFSFLIGGVTLRGMALWEEKTNDFYPVVSHYAVSCAWSWDRWTWYAEASYRNGVVWYHPQFEDTEATNVVVIIPGVYEITNITPSKYEFVKGDMFAMAWEGLLGMRVELEWNITLRAEVFYQERSWNEEERGVFWRGVHYARERYGHEDFVVGDVAIPEAYLRQATGMLSVKTYAPWMVSCGFSKGFGDHWEVDQSIMMELASFSWRYDGSVNWKSLQLWEIKCSWSWMGGKRESLFGELLESTSFGLVLQSAL